MKNHWKTHLSKKFGSKNNESNAVGSSTTLFGDDGGPQAKSLVSGNSTSKLPSKADCSRITGPQVIDGFQKGTMPCGPLEQTMSDFHLNSYWFPSANSDPNATDLMELLDGFSVEVAWNSF